MPKKIETLSQKAIEENVFPGCVVGWVKKNGEREIFPFGKLTYDEDAPEVREGTVYDVASITKSIPTASLALQLIHTGKFELSDTVSKYIPELKNDYGATVEDLLRYRVHGPQFSPLQDKTPGEMLAHIFAQGFEEPAGKSHYTNLPAFLLGLIVERVTGNTIDVLAQRSFFGPLEMSRTSFFPENKNDVAPTEIEDGVEVRGIVHDESARVFAKAGRAVGHAGLFSTAPDILNFLRALLEGRLAYVVDGARKGLGWQLKAAFMGSHAGPHTFGKTGFTGTSFVCDTERGIAFVILSNRTYPKRPPNGQAIEVFRANVADIILET